MGVACTHTHTLSHAYTHTHTLSLSRLHTHTHTQWSSLHTYHTRCCLCTPGGSPSGDDGLAGLSPAMPSPQELDYIHTGLWKKLPVGQRLHVFFPWVPPTCPFEGSQEDMYHRLKACSWLTVPVRILQCTFGLVFSASGRAPINRLRTDYPLLSLTRAPGLLLWKIARVLWVCRCNVPIRSAALDHSAFLRVLYSEVSKWLEMPSLSLSQCICFYVVFKVGSRMATSRSYLVRRLCRLIRDPRPPHVTTGQCRRSGAETGPCGTSREGSGGNSCA